MYVLPKFTDFAIFDDFWSFLAFFNLFAALNFIIVVALFSDPNFCHFSDFCLFLDHFFYYKAR